MKTSASESLRGTTFGDLHLLASRQRRFREEAWLGRWRDDYDLCVLNGDIFDFHWARQDAPEPALEAARSWLDRLVRGPVRARFLITMGNHDALPAYRSILASLEFQYAHVRVAEHWARLGDKVFFHGDFPDGSGEVERLRHARQLHGARRRPGRGRRGLYWMATQAGLAGFLPRALPWRRFCARSEGFLAREIGPDFDRVEHVYLAHSHVHYRDVVVHRRRFHNSGTPLPGALFRPIDFDFSESDWRALQVG